MMKRFIRQKNRNSKTMGVVLLIAVLCLSVVYAALYSVIYMYGTGSVDISYKDLYYWVDTSTGKGNFYTSCTNGTATSSTGITKMSVAVNALKEGGTIHMLSPYSATAEETVSVNSKTVKIQRYVQKGENNKVEYSNEKEPLFNVSANLKFDLVKVGTEAPCLTIDGSEITSDASAFNVLSGGTLTLNNDADGVAQGTFVVTGNYAKVSGGAVNLSGGSLVANAVQFTDNRSINTLESYGGAIYASGGSNVTLNNCSFENNTARSSTKINVEGTIYQKGEHPAYGGAVYSISSTVNMSGCTFTANAADVEGDNGVLASGGAVYIGSQSSGSMKDCTVTNNQTSYNGRTGAGVCVAVGGNNFAFSGKTIIENNHCYFLGADIDNGLNENDNLHLEGGEASNISVDTSKLSAGSKIYITASPSPSENSDFRSLISDKSHKASSTDYFLSDVGGYVVQSNADSNDGGLYLVAGSSYTDLWYGCKNIYQFDRYGKVDGNYFYYGFFGDEALTQDTGFTRLTDAVAALQTGGKIHMLKTYKVSVSETVNMPENKTVNVVRESSLGGNSMFKLQEGTFIINSLKDSSTIIFDGQGQNLSASTSGGAFSATRNTTNSGENNFELNGIQKSDGTKSIIIQNNKITGYNFGGGLYIWSDKSKISNCEIRNNSTEKTGGGIYFSNSMGSYVLENCNVTSNTASENGGGVYLDYGTYAMLGTMNITGNTVNGAANNLYVVNAVGLASGSSSLNTGSQIGLTTSSTPAEGSPVKFASSATEAMKACFTPDVSNYKVKYNSSDNGLYLAVPTYSDLWYKADENDSNTKKFFEGSDVNNLTATDITKFSKAVQCLSASGKIHMLTTYESAENETTTMPAGKNVTVLREGTFTNASMFKITGGTFEVSAIDASSSITFDGQKIETTVDKGGAFNVDGGSIKFSGAEKTVENKKEKTIVIKDNIISLSSDTSNVYASGGGVYLGGSGTSTLTNCSITGNKVSTSSTTKDVRANGGGVYIVDGVNTLTNCSITGNTASATTNTAANAFAYTDGGGIYISGGTNTLENCSITGNTASSSASTYASAYGGGVYIGGYSGTNTLTNCSITANKVSATTTESAYVYGGGVYINRGTNTLTNCSITENKAESSKYARGGGVYINNGTNKLLGTMNITGNTGIVGSDISDNNLYLYINQTVASSDSDGNKLSTSSNIGVTTYDTPKDGTDVQFATNATEEMKACFTHDPGTSEVVYKDGGLYLAAPTYSELWYKADENDSNTKKFFKGSDVNNLTATDITKFSKAVQSMSASGKIHMLTTYESKANETTTMPAGKNITVLRDGTFNNASMFKITKGTFEIDATDESSSVTFDGQKIETSVERGGAFCVSGSSTKFTLNGADKYGGGKTIAIENNVIYSSGSTQGSGVYIWSGTSTLENCSIAGNIVSSSSAACGGGVLINGGANTLTNCSITGNTASSSASSAYGGGVFLSGSGTSTLTNCSITGNTASSSASYSYYYAEGGGVFIDYETTNTLLGTMNITGNTAKVRSTSSDGNLYFSNGETVALSDSSGDTLSADSHIGVTTQASAPAKFATGVTDDIAAVRFCFDDDKKANEVYRIGTELYLGKDSSVTYEKYDNLYYYRTTTGDNNDGLFYTDSSHSNSTGITALSEAVGHLNKGGNIYFMSSYTTSTTGEMVVAPPDMGEIHIIRYSSSGTTFDGESMININGLFEVTCPHTNSTIIFDGNNVSTKNTGAGILWLWQTGSARIIGASPSCKNIKFVNSIITTGGGAAIRLGGGDNVIKNCIIEGNKKTSTASEGSGAVLLLEDGGHANSTSMENCDLINNTSAGNAGALYVASGTHSFTNCNITNNQGFGGGSYINGGTNSFTGCKISNNTSVKVESIEPYGGGLYINKGTNYFLNCEINGNKAHNGGGLISKSATNTFEKCTVSGNVIDDYGNGLCLDGSSNTIIDCTITDNKGASHGAGIWVGGGTVNIYGNTVVKNNVLNDGTTENNVEVGSGKKVSLNDSAGKVLGTSSNIGITTYTAPTSSAPVQFATGASEEMKACFTADNSDYYVDYKDSDNSLYLCVRTTYSDLYYKEGEFYSDSACSNSTGITKMSEAVASMTSSGKIHMLSQYASSADETVTVLSGRNVTVLRESSFTNASMFSITKGTFEVNATNATSSITFDGQKIETTVYEGGAFYVGSGGSLKLSGAEKTVENKKVKTIVIKDNIISRPSDTSDVYTDGGGIYIDGGTNTLTNCSVTGNKAKSSPSRSSASGGGIYINGGKNTLTNCSITGNAATANTSSSSVSGGGVYIWDGTNTLTNCSITDNKAESSYFAASGGGFELRGGTNTLTNCSITGNTASAGSSEASGGGIFTQGSGTNTLSNCSITGNMATANTRSSSFAYGGGIYTYKNITLLGTVNITGNTCKTLYASSDNNLHLGNNFMAALSDSNGNTLSTSSKIGVSTKTAPTEGTDVQFATNATEEMKACFTADDDNYIVKYKDSGLYLGVKSSDLYYKNGTFYTDEACSNSSGFTKLSEAVDSISSLGTIHMMSQYASSADEETNVTAGKSIKVVRHKDFKDASMFKITGGTFTVNAPNATSSITFDGNKDNVTASVDKGGAFYVGTNGSIKFSGAEKSDGGKTIAIQNNVISASSAYGSGVYISGIGVNNTLENCSITGNTASSSSDARGGGVYITGIGTNTLENCSITGNTASSSDARGGGVYIAMEATLVGTMNITGNTVKKGSTSSDNNLYLSSGKTVTLSSGSKSLSMSSNIGVTTKTAPTASTPAKFATNATEEMKACFTADDGNYIVKYNSSDQGLYLGVRYSNLYYKNNNFYSDSACSSTTGITKFSDAVSSMTSTGIIHMMGTYSSSASETVTVPAGKNIKVVRDSSFADDSMFNITGGAFTVNATDASSSITFDGKNITTSTQFGGAFYVRGDSTEFTLNGTDKSGGGKTITIENNAIFVSTSQVYGGGIYLNGGVNTLSGCSITGNNVKSTTKVPLGGGVCIKSGTNTILGSVNITGNTATKKTSTSSNNLYFASSKTVALSSGSKSLSTSSQIGVTTQTAPTSSTPAKFATGATSAMASCFTSDNSSYKVTYSSSALSLAVK